MTASSRFPEISVILPTDNYETMRPVLEKLREQTIASRIEVIVLAPSLAAIAGVQRHAADFASVQTIEVAALSPLSSPRAVGMRAATAPLIFVGETHSFLHPDAAEKLLAAVVSGPWAVVTPGFENANPKSVLSWAAFLGAYGRWIACLPAGEIPEAPLYDALYRREGLLGFGENLENMLAHGDQLRRAMQARGDRVYFEPAARIEHLNIANPAPWLHEHFLIGLAIGSRRAQGWSWWRRLFYIAVAWAIPAVLLYRVWPGLRKAAETYELPAGTLPAVLFLFYLKVAGEVVGYAGGGGRIEQEQSMNDYEVRRVDYVD